MRTQWASSSWPALSPTISARRCMSLTLTMLMSLSKQKDWMRVKWICRAMSHSNSSSTARTQKDTLSGSLWRQRKVLLAAAAAQSQSCWIFREDAKVAFKSCLVYLLSHDFSALVDSNSESLLVLSADQSFFQSFSRRLHGDAVVTVQLM